MIVPRVHCRDTFLPALRGPDFEVFVHTHDDDVRRIEIRIVTQGLWRRMLATPLARVPARRGSLEQLATLATQGTSITRHALSVQQQRTAVATQRQ